MSKRVVDFDEVCRQWVHRFTCEHFPEWARKPMSTGRFYAPPYISDREWFDNSIFPGEAQHKLQAVGSGYCLSKGQTWPIGESLPEVFALSKCRFDLVRADGSIWKSLLYYRLAAETAARDSSLSDVGSLTIIAKWQGGAV